ncbi:hypothetical protein GCM10009789_87530 [Kribbella sancticallisti]|uniref:Uncharacterized protein n=1 Tax=Kribbella sancticallisti TaxID=460087 RepID=A0ABN2EWQ9_9ACTN
MSKTLRFGTVPTLLAVYATARPIDGSDGDYGPGLAWNVGHIAFLGAFIGFGALTSYFWRASPRPHTGVVASALASLVGVALFCWVILTDLIPPLDEQASLPDPVMALGPIVFIIGFVASLAMHGYQTKMRLWWLPPTLTLAGLLTVGANLDLLPVTTGLVSAALLWTAANQNESQHRQPATGKS